MERVEVISTHTGEVTDGCFSRQLLTWAEFQTVATDAHPDPRPAWNSVRCFPTSQIGIDARSSKIAWQSPWLSHHASTFQHSGKRKGKPGVPTAANHPTLTPETYARPRSAGPAQELSPPQGLDRRAVGVGPLSDPLQRYFE